MIKLNALAQQINPSKVVVKNSGLIAATGTAVIWLTAAAITLPDTPAAARVGVAEMFVISGVILVAAAFFLDRR
jgi:hypothetical protein